MDFNEKLQMLRKNKGLTQEELAEALFVSRAAVSKWESGRGYPSIDSLKDISVYFSVSIDDLLSGEKLISIAEKENRANIKKLCNFLFGIMDLFFIMLMVLPLYPDTVDGFVYSVQLFRYDEISQFNLIFYWGLFLFLLVAGFIKIVLTKYNFENGNKILTVMSFSVNIIAVLFLAMTREAYAAMIVFIILLIKAMIFFKGLKMRK